MTRSEIRKWLSRNVVWPDLSDGMSQREVVAVLFKFQEYIKTPKETK